MTAESYRGGAEALKSLSECVTAAEALGMWWANAMLFTGLPAIDGLEKPEELGRLRADALLIGTLLAERKHVIDTVGGFALAVTDLAAGELALILQDPDRSSGRLSLASNDAIEDGLTLTTSNTVGNSAPLLQLAAQKSGLDLRQVPVYPAQHMTILRSDELAATMDLRQPFKTIWPI